MSARLTTLRCALLLVLAFAACLSVGVCASTKTKAGSKTDFQRGAPPFVPGSPSFAKPGSRGDAGVVPVAEDHDDEFTYDSEDATLSTHELLEKHGLSDVANKLSKFIEMFDSGTHFFAQLNRDDQFSVLNRVIDAFKWSFVTTMNEVMNAKDAPTGPISLPMMKDFFNRQEMHFKQSIKQDPRIYESEWISFLGQVHVVFDSLKKLYQLALESHISLDWWMLKFATPMLEKIPSDLFDRSMFSELLSLPLGIKTTIHDTIESALSSDYGPMVKIGVSLLANYDWRKLMEGEHADL